MRKVSLLLAVLMLITMFSSTITNAQEMQTKISINGNLVEFNEQTGYPFVDENNRTLVPFRATLEAFGATVSWNQDTRMAKSEKNNINVEVPIGQAYILVEGMKVENDTFGVIKSGKTYVPIRKVMEAYDCIVEWDTATKTVNINNLNDISVAKPEYKGNKELFTNIKEKIDYIYDIRLFTLYAFMNYTGYDDENNDEGFSQVREMVRKDLDDMNLQISNDNYYKNKNVEYHYYRLALQQMGNAPEFNYIGSKNSVKSSLSDLNIHLKEFYQKANIEELYEKYRPFYEEQLEKYKDIEVVGALADTIEYLDLDVDDVPEFFIQVNLLDAYERGGGLGSTDELLGKGITTGPSDDANTINIVHEFLHGVINPILDDIGQKGKEEDIIRALSGFIVFKDDEALNYVNRESEKKYKMTRYYFDKFSTEYEDYDGTLKEFIRGIIK